MSDSLRPMNLSMPGLPVHHQLPEFTQTHVHQVGDAIQASHPLSSPSPPASNPSQHQSLFQWVSSSHEVAKVLGLLREEFSSKIVTCVLSLYPQSYAISSLSISGLNGICAIPLILLWLFISLEKEMATHSSILAWKIPWTEEPGGLKSMGSQRVGQ